MSDTDELLWLLSEHWINFSPDQRRVLADITPYRNGRGVSDLPCVVRGLCNDQATARAYAELLPRMIFQSSNEEKAEVK